MTSRETPDPQQEGISLFRYGEVFVMFRRTTPPENTERRTLETLTDELNDPGFYLAMVDAFKGADVSLFPRMPFVDKQGNPAPRFAAVSRGKEAFGFGRVALDGVWTPDLEHINVQGSGDPPGLDEANRAVPIACNRLNNPEQPIVVGDWLLVATTPHWRVSALCNGTTGGPGGRPVKPLTPKSFVRDEVLDQVTMRLQSDGAGNLDGSGVRVAILDSWPMDDEPDIPVGERPDNPLGRIRAYLADPSNTAAASNPHLQRADAETLVDHTMFRDYVSGQTTKSPPHRRYNQDTHRFEPFYQVADHGLFVAGIIRDIAPNAELAVYRVLNEYGSADMDTVVLALKDAIEDARDDDKKLIVNLSLTVGPPMRTIKSLLEDPVGNQKMAKWGPLVESVGMPGEPQSLYYSEDPDHPGEGLLLNDDGLVMREVDGQGVRVWRLTGALAAIDYLFRLDKEEDVFVVASAGNNSNYPEKVYGPRLPAFVEGVLGVSTTGAYYSNHDDIETNRDDGMGARGGRAATPDVSDPDATSDAVQGEAVVGPGIAPIMPAPKRYLVGDPPIPEPNVPNNDGWIEWAGTSFAAPIATGLAAIIWGERLIGDSSYPPQKLLKDMVGRPPRRFRNIELWQH